MDATQTMDTVPFDAVSLEYVVPVDPMDELQCDSCQ
jgi:hypothetical protein